MIQIKTTSIHSGLWHELGYSNENQTVNDMKYSFEVDGTSITYKLINSTNNKLLQSICFDYNFIKQHKRFGDQTLWAFTNDVLSSVPLDTDSTSSFVRNLNLNDGYIVNVMDHTNQTKYEKVTEYNNLEKTVFKVFVPSVNSTIEDLIFVIPRVRSSETCNETFEIVGSSDINTTPDNSIPEGKNWTELISNITFTSEISGENITVTATTEDTSISTIYLEQVVGMLNKVQVPLINGVGTFVISTANLVSGDIIKVKVGYKSFSNRATFTKTI